MKKNYIYPATEICVMNGSAFLCASGAEPVNTNIGIKGGDKPSDVTTAF